jgi:hypothetical protein
MICATALLLLAVKISWAPATNPRPPQEDDLAVTLSKRVSSYDIGTLSLVGALIRVSNDFHVPMGIVWVNSASARAERPFAWKDATVQEIIQTIVSTQHGYQVLIRDRVVHVFPPISDNQNFLKTNIGEFSVHDADVELAYFKLRTLLRPPEHGNRFLSIAGPGDSKVTVELKNSPVEDVLDALTVASNLKIWIVTFSNDNRLTPSGFRVTKSVWTDQAVPEKEQPTWALLHWGDPTPPLVGNQPSQAAP